jgi:hypothetical protein
LVLPSYRGDNRAVFVVGPGKLLHLVGNLLVLKGLMFIIYLFVWFVLAGDVSL